MVATMKKDRTYNGWKNRSTWAASLWINNDEYIYNEACAFMEQYHGQAPYAAFIRRQGWQDEHTPDGTRWMAHGIGFAELNEMMRDLIG